MNDEKLSLFYQFNGFLTSLSGKKSLFELLLCFLEQFNQKSFILFQFYGNLGFLELLYKSSKVPKICNKMTLLELKLL